MYAFKVTEALWYVVFKFHIDGALRAVVVVHCRWTVVLDYNDKITYIDDNNVTQQET